MKPTINTPGEVNCKGFALVHHGPSPPQIVHSSVLGADGHTAPSNRITVGFIGTGSHGVGWNLGPYLRHNDAQVVAVCDVDDGHLMRARETVNERYQNEDCFATKDFRAVLARKDIDTVIISTPDHWHTLISLFAIQSGKDVQFWQRGQPRRVSITWE